MPAATKDSATKDLHLGRMRALRQTCFPDVRTLFSPRVLAIQACVKQDICSLMLEEPTCQPSDEELQVHLPLAVFVAVLVAQGAENDSSACKYSIDFMLTMRRKTRAPQV